MSIDPGLRTDYCVFRRGDCRFAISTELAKEVIERRSLTEVPHAPPELLGALNLRGEVVPLVSLDAFLDLPPRPLARGDSLLVLAMGDLRFAAVVDQVDSVKHFAPWEIRRESDGPHPTSSLVRGTTGSGEERLVVLNGENLISTVVQRVAEGFRRNPNLEPRLEED